MQIKNQFYVDKDHLLNVRQKHMTELLCCTLSEGHK